MRKNKTNTPEKRQLEDSDSDFENNFSSKKQKKKDSPIKKQKKVLRVNDLLKIYVH